MSSISSEFSTVIKAKCIEVNMKISVMDGALPAALVQVLTNCGFFGASLFHNGEL